MNHCLYRYMLAMLWLCFAGGHIFAQTAKQKTVPTKPKAIFVIAFDQMRGDYTETFAETWGEQGFKRLMREGAYFPNCYFNHASNLTAPGHAVHLTGCYPHKTGIVSNDYYDRRAGTELYCVQDTMRRTFGMSNPKEWHSPSNLQAQTLGSYLKRISPKSKVIGVSQKDRAAILMSGHDADAAFWFEYEAGGYTTSNYYTEEYPLWLKEWNERHSLQSYAGKIWEPVITNAKVARPDSLPFEAMPGGRFVFPYQLPSADSLKQLNARFLLSPFSIEHCFQFARHIIERENIGRNGQTDLFCMSVSATDYIGHQFGPDSREVLEVYTHVDRYMGEFLTYLDSTLGKGNYTIVITADHGVAPCPEYIKYTQGDTASAGRIKGLELIEAMEEYLRTTFSTVSTVKVNKWIKDLQPPSIFLHPDALNAVKRSVLLDSLYNFLKRYPGMGPLVKTDDLVANRCPKDLSREIFNLIRNDYFEPRTGELMFYPRYNWMLGSITATHGTPHDYDRHVPMILLNAGVKAGKHAQRVSPADIAPTLARLLRITMKNTDGKAITVK